MILPLYLIHYQKLRIWYYLGLLLTDTQVHARLKKIPQTYLDTCFLIQVSSEDSTTKCFCQPSCNFSLALYLSCFKSYFLYVPVQSLCQQDLCLLNKLMSFLIYLSGFNKWGIELKLSQSSLKWCGKSQWNNFVLVWGKVQS